MDKEKLKELTTIMDDFAREVCAIRTLELGIMLGEGGYSTARFLLAFVQNHAINRILRLFDQNAPVYGDSSFEDVKAALLSAYPEPPR